MKATLQRLAAALVIACAVAVLPVATMAQDAPEIRTEAPGLGGYTAEASGAPLSMLIFEPVIPIPVDPGEPHMEGTLSYTSSELRTGPQSRAVASSVWPGPAFGDGFPTICGCGEEWFVRAEAVYPGEGTDVEQALPTGGGMSASARGLDVRARADAGDSPSAENFVYGDMASQSTSTVQEGSAVSTLDASVRQISIAGVIAIDSIRTTLQASSDATTGASTGATTVDGLTIAGNGYTLDEGGLRPVQGGAEGEGVPPPAAVPGVAELRDNLGIEIAYTPQTETITGANATREAAGVRISINTAVLKAALAPVPIGDVLAPLPDELETQLYPLLSLGPRIDFVFGRGEVMAAATKPITFSPIAPLPPPAALAPPAASAVGTTTGRPPAPPAAPAASVPGGATATAPSPGSSAVPQTTVSEAIAPTGTLPTTLATSSGLPLTDGIPAALVALAMVAAGAGARGLSALTGLAFGGAGGPICTRGAAQRVTDLRSQG